MTTVVQVGHLINETRAGSCKCGMHTKNTLQHFGGKGLSADNLRIFG